MVDLRKLIETVSGREPTPARIERIQAIAHQLDISASDAMFPILVALDSYYDAIFSIPDRIVTAAEQTNRILGSVTENAAKQAAEKTRTEVVATVASLAPTVDSAVKEAAKGAVASVVTEMNLHNVLIGALVAAVIFAAGIFEGSGLLRVLVWGRVDILAFTNAIGVAIGIGIAVAALGLWSTTAVIENRAKIQHWVAGCVAGVMATVLIAGAVNFAFEYRLSGNPKPIECVAAPLMPPASPSGR